MNRNDNQPRAIHLTIDDVALLADGQGNIPDETATRLKDLILFGDSDEIEFFWRTSVMPWLEELRQMARDARVELLADGLYVFRGLECLRSMRWEKPAEVFDQRLDIPYHELILMALARAGRAEKAEKIELERLAEDLSVALVAEIRDADFVEPLVDRLLEISEEVADEVLGQVIAHYRQRRRAGGIN